MRKPVSFREAILIYDGTKSTYPKGVTVVYPAGGAGNVYVTAGERSELDRLNNASTTPLGGIVLAPGASTSYTYFQDKLYARADKTADPTGNSPVEVEVQDYRMFDWVQHYFDLLKNLTGVNKLREAGTSPQSHA